MSPYGVDDARDGYGFPRVSGDEPLGDITQINWDEVFPA